MKIKLDNAVVDTDFVRFTDGDLWIYLSNGGRIIVPLYSKNKLVIRDMLFKEDKIDLSSYKYEYANKSYDNFI